jgi:hypothetical protein
MCYLLVCMLNSCHVLQARTYHLQKLDNEESNAIDFSQPVLDDGCVNPAACAAAVIVKLRVS